MKRLWIMFLIIGFVVGSVAVGEAKRTPRRVERTVERTYGPYIGPFTACSDPGGSLACVEVNTRSTERFVTAKATDAHGQPVFVQVRQGRPIGTFCGETTEAIKFDPGSRLEFRIDPMTHFWSNWGTDWVGPLDCPFRVKTTGTISVTLSNRP